MGALFDGTEAAAAADVDTEVAAVANTDGSDVVAAESLSAVFDRIVVLDDTDFVHCTLDIVDAVDYLAVALMMEASVILNRVLYDCRAYLPHRILAALIRPYSSHRSQYCHQELLCRSQLCVANRTL